MASETDLLNDALGQAGLPSITSLSAPNEPNAQWCRTFYPETRRGFLRAYRPNFSHARAQLQANATPPPFEFTTAWDLPANYLMLITYNGGATTAANMDPDWRGVPVSWKIEGGQILSNDPVALIKYVKDQPNTLLWDPLCCQVVAAILSSKLIAAVWKDITKSQAKMKEAMELWLPMATAADGQSNSTEPFVVDDLTHGR